MEENLDWEEDRIQQETEDVYVLLGCLGVCLFGIFIVAIVGMAVAYVAWELTEFIK
jgi:hypothetical protein